MRRSSAFAIFLLLSVLPVSLLAQQAKQATAPERDPQAVSILRQSLATGGGPAALATVLDFTATGKIIYYWTEGGDVGTVTVKSRGLNQFRMESAVSDGVLTSIIDNGQARHKDADGTVRQMFNQHTENAGAAYLPFAEIAAALINPAISVTDLGMVTENGQTTHGIRLQKTFSARDDSDKTLSKLTQRDVFIDPATLLAVRTRDLSPTRSNPVPSIIHDVTFSNYKPLNGVLFPMSVTEFLNHQQVVAIQFDNVKFNGGLGDTDFQL